MKEKRQNKNRKDKYDTTSISTPLGHISINSELKDESFVKWTKDILDGDNKNHESN